jgi:hypothetical protein
MEMSQTGCLNKQQKVTLVCRWMDVFSLCPQEREGGTERGRGREARRGRSGLFSEK